MLDFLLLLFMIALIGRVILEWVQALAREWKPRGAVLVGAEGVYTVTDPPEGPAQGDPHPSFNLGAIRLDLSFIVLFWASACCGGSARMSITWTFVAVLAFLSPSPPTKLPTPWLCTRWVQAAGRGMGLPLFRSCVCLRPWPTFQSDLLAWLIAAYVEPDEGIGADDETRSYLDQVLVRRCRSDHQRDHRVLPCWPGLPLRRWAVPGLVMIGLAAVIAVARRPVSALVPFLGIGALVLVAISLASAWARPKVGRHRLRRWAVSGPMGALQITA